MIVSLMYKLNLIQQRHMAQLQLMNAMRNWNEMGVIQSNLKLQMIEAQLKSFEGKKLDKTV